MSPAISVLVDELASTGQPHLPSYLAQGQGVGHRQVRLLCDRALWMEEQVAQQWLYELIVCGDGHAETTPSSHEVRALHPGRHAGADFKVAEDVFDLGQGGAEVVGDFLGEDVGVGEAGRVLEGFVAQPEQI